MTLNDKNINRNNHTQETKNIRTIRAKLQVLDVYIFSII